MEFNNCALLICCAVTFVMLLLLAGKRMRPWFPVHVTCWFCSAKTSVPYGNRNCWDCPECEQYNGFDKDGSYNKPIPAQYDDQYNNPITCQQDEYIGGRTIMCDRCTQNQLLKVKQLANFMPYSENNYNSEVEAFSRHLEKVYKLCPKCESKVQQELQIQNEALTRRLQNIDSYKSLLQKASSYNDSGEQSVLHSTYSELPYDKFLTASLWFHTVSMLCSTTVLIQHISRNEDWQHWLKCIHPMLNILDKHTSLLAEVGLSSGLLSKLCLGKYRLHVIDVISCPLSLLALLYETDFVSLGQHTNSIYYMSFLVVNCLACALCLGINRRPKNQSKISIIRTTLDSSSTDKYSNNSFAPVIPTATKSSIHCTEDELDQNQVKEKNFEMREFAKKDSSHSDMSSCRLTDTSQSNVDETTSELNSITLGGLPMKQIHSGLFSTASQSKCASNLGSQSSTQNLWSRKISKAQSLITPATFRHFSSPDNHRHSPVLMNGLINVPTTQTESHKPSYLDKPSSTFCSTSLTSNSPYLFSSPSHSLTSSRPGTPIITSFGVTPFSNIQIPSGTPPHSTLSHPLAFHSGKSLFTENRYSVARPRSAVPKSKFSTEPEWADDDNSSDITSVSQRCPVDSTTLSLVPECSKVSLWQHPGLIGFVLGGSVVANVVLAVQMIWFNKSESR